MSNPLLTLPQLRALRSLSTRTLERQRDDWSDGRQAFALVTIARLRQRGFAKLSKDRRQITITPAGLAALSSVK